jgi:SAM-dependent methyltransferase
VEAIFETWAGDANPFDLICAAQAWHWVEPVAGYAKASSLLAPGGLLAIFGNVDLPPPEPLQGELKQAFREAFSESRGGAASAAYRPEGWIAQQFEASGLFGPLQHHVYHHAMEYDPERYAALVSTLSDVQMLAPDRRAHLIENLQAAVARNGGRFTQQMETHLHWAVKRSPGG